MNLSGLTQNKIAENQISISQQYADIIFIAKKSFECGFF